MDLPSSALDGHRPRRTSRGVGWVLGQAAALAVFAIAAVVLLRFGYLVSAERNLAQAACAGAHEATLPRATLTSIRNVVRQQLDGDPALNRVEILVTQNGTRVTGRIGSERACALSVHISVSPNDVLPNWLARASGWLPDGDVCAQAHEQRY